MERIIVQISRYLSEALAAEIARAQWHSDAPMWVNRLRRDIFDEDAGGACFEVVARTAGGAAVGRLHCIRNRQDPTLWYYGDLFVVPAYRRSGIALLMLEEAKNHLLEIGARRLRCYVEPQNTPSLRLQKKAGFLEKPFENFNHLQNEGRIMLECEFPLPFTVIPATADEACFVFGLYAQNRTALHAGSITLSEWRELLACGDADEAHFLICKGGDAGGVYEAQRAVEYGHGLPFYAVRRKAASARRNRPFCGRIRGTLPCRARVCCGWHTNNRRQLPRASPVQSLRLFRRAEYRS